MHLKKIIKHQSMKNFNVFKKRLYWLKKRNSQMYYIHSQFTEI